MILHYIRASDYEDKEIESRFAKAAKLENFGRGQGNYTYFQNFDCLLMAEIYETAELLGEFVDIEEWYNTRSTGTPTSQKHQHPRSTTGAGEDEHTERQHPGSTGAAGEDEHAESSLAQNPQIP
ncbi:hypothetical protein L2E82_31382 [Cichorium intybus]|uniref:Uncharacterized protein n=1 Tax=Cichorium intybus TaxID=13427 RepID=A0ACB9D3P2_CICIN|nr:hypothetical protein L2E82_31382 [Cichorium intybus]